MAADSEREQLSNSFPKRPMSVEALLKLLEKSKKESSDLAIDALNNESFQLCAARRDDSVIIDHIRQAVLVIQEQQKLIAQQENTITRLEGRLAAVEAEFAPRRPLLDKPSIKTEGPQ